MYKLLLTQCRLFAGLEVEQIEGLLSQVDYSIRSYSRGDVIALQGSRLSQMNILVDGSLTAEANDKGSSKANVEVINAPALIAPAFVFAENPQLPVSISAKTPVEMLQIPRKEFVAMLRSDAMLLTNYLGVLSDQNNLISEHVMYLTYKTIKGKFASYVLGQMNKVGTETFTNNLTQREMADMFGVTRPALARAVGELAREGAIYVKSKQITVLFPEKLMQYVKNR